MSEKRVEIQWLRGLAALEVAIVHSDLLTKHISTQSVLTGWYQHIGGIGVEVFFIVSGFIMCMRVPFSTGWRDFMMNRIRRIFPLYWILTSVAVLIFIMQPSWVLVGRTFSLEWLLSSYLILPQHREPPLGPGWTLEHEMVFYALVALGLAVLSAHIYGRLAFGVFVGALGVLGCAFGPGLDQPAWMSHLVSPYMLAFSFGWLVRCCEEMDSRRVWPALLGFFAAVALLGLALGADWSDRLVLRFLLAGAIFLSFIAARHLATLKTVFGRFMLLLGEASFSLYLIHWFVLSALGKFLGMVLPDVDQPAPLRILGVAVACYAGILCFRYVEQPIDRFLRSKGPLRMAQALSGRFRPALPP